MIHVLEPSGFKPLKFGQQREVCAFFRSQSLHTSLPTARELIWDVKGQFQNRTDSS